MAKIIRTKNRFITVLLLVFVYLTGCTIQEEGVSNNTEPPFLIAPLSSSERGDLYEIKQIFNDAGFRVVLLPLTTSKKEMKSKDNCISDICAIKNNNAKTKIDSFEKGDEIPRGYEIKIIYYDYDDTYDSLRESNDSYNDSTFANDQEYTYVINTNTGVFHNEQCRYTSRISKENKLIVTSTRSSIVEQGYTPCDVCCP